jgi:hypothetical protein
MGAFKNVALKNSSFKKKAQVLGSKAPLSLGEGSGVRSKQSDNLEYIPNNFIENCIFIYMETIVKQPRNLLYKQIVSRLKTKSEEELKLLYLNLFADDLQKEWETITQKSKFGNITEKELISAIKYKT